jgi:hypothetical protein
MLTPRYPLRRFALVIMIWGFANTATPAARPQQPPATPASDRASRPAASTVWVKTSSGHYHKPNSRHYGKTKHGKYMTEPGAIRAGYRPARN